MTRLLAASIALLALPALAQKEEIFGDGKPPNFREETMDKRFLRTRFAKAMAAPEVLMQDQGCVQLYSGLLLALGEIGPLVHKRDDNFILDPVLQNMVQQQLSPPSFPAMAFLVSMYRRMMIEKRLPDDWLKLAIELNKQVKILDLPKLKMMNEGLNPIDSAYFSLPLLKERYVIETMASTSAVTRDTVADFRDTYLDRDVTWTGMQLVEIGVNQPPGKKKKRYRDAEAEELIAILHWYPPDPRRDKIDLTARAPVKFEPMVVYVRLQSKQYSDIEKFFRGQRVMVKGRFWEMTKNMKEFEIRDGLIFKDFDWSNGVVIANPQMVAACPVAINELTGIAEQKGGFAH